MLALNTLFESGNIILQETLVDQVFKSIQIVKNNEPSLELFDKIEKIFKEKFDIIIEFVRNQNNFLEGQFIRPNKIEILFPNNISSFEQVNQKHLITILLHEFSHYITDTKIPNLINVKNQKEQSLAQQLVPPAQNIMFNDNFKNVQQKLDYVLHIRELPNFAFSIAVSMIFYKKPNSTKENKVAIDQYFTNKNNFERNNYYALLRGDIKELFEIQYFVRYVKEINKNMYPKYLKKVKRFENLIKKYYRRLTMYF